MSKRDIYLLYKIKKTFFLHLVKNKKVSNIHFFIQVWGDTVAKLEIVLGVRDIQNYF